MGTKTINIVENHLNLANPEAVSMGISLLYDLPSLVYTNVYLSTSGRKNDLSLMSGFYGAFHSKVVK